jgi:adenosylcobyric acid synthase
VIVAGLCRSLARSGVRVAPFKAQNMSNNSSVAVDGGEIGRAQFAQARAAGIEATTAMNPVLLKPTADHTCEVIVRGRLAGRSSAAEQGAWIERLRAAALAGFEDLASTYDAVIAEGAGGAAEINLLDRDIANLPLAAATGLPAIVVADIERGGAFSGLFGVWAILPEHLRATIGGFVINRFRGDPDLLRPGIAELEVRTGVPVLGVVPWLDGVRLDEEDSEFLVTSSPEHVVVDVAVLRYPHVANTSDLDPLAAEPGVRVRWIERASELGEPDLIVLPGSKNTCGDLSWLRATGLDAAIVERGATIVGICAGYQMLGEHILDEVESGAGRVHGLGLLRATTEFHEEKVVRRSAGSCGGHPVAGYEIRHGRPRVRGGVPWLLLEGARGAEEEGCVDPTGRIFGTSMHGIFEADAFRRAFLASLGSQAAGGTGEAEIPYAQVLQGRADALADHLESHLDTARLWDLAGISPGSAASDQGGTLPFA